MEDRVWTIIGISLSSVALTLVIVLFVIIIISASKNNNNTESLQPKTNSLGYVLDAISNESVQLNEPPNTLDGVQLDKGNVIYLNAQENESENGFYNVNTGNTWSRVQQESNNRHLVYVRNGREFGRNLMMVGGNTSPMILGNQSDRRTANEQVHNSCIIKPEDIATTTRRLTTQEIIRGSVICEANVILPDPVEFNFSSIGEMITVNIFNRSEEEDIEVGYSSHWVSKCEHTNVDRLTGCILALRHVGDAKGEVYRVSV